MEGITFRLTVPRGEEVTAEDLHSEADSYLSKFAGVYEDIADQINSFVSSDKLAQEAVCPHGGEQHCLLRVGNSQQDTTRVMANIELGSQKVLVQVGRGGDDVCLSPEEAQDVAEVIPDDAVIDEPTRTRKTLSYTTQTC